MTRDGRPIGVFDSGLGGLTVVRVAHRPAARRGHRLLRRHRPVPVRAEAADEVLQVLARDHRRAARARVKMLVVACNSAAAAALDQLQARVDIPVIGVIEPGIRAARARDADGSRRRDRHRRHDRVGRVPARGGRVRARRRRSRARRARASSSSSRPATSTPTRCTCSPSGCSRRSSTPASTRSCSAARTTRCSPARSAT